mmetsp:Transcript_109512/g.305231  ORF Transcript_109512/g.305231 Transcript_109512/m.305231 type:complete len:373 (+) Transcript_109512:1-1119(+)
MPEEQARLPGGAPAGERSPDHDAPQVLDLMKVIDRGGCAVVVLARDHEGSSYAVKFEHLRSWGAKAREVLAREIPIIKHLREELRRYRQDNHHKFPFLISTFAEFSLDSPLENKRTLHDQSIIADKNGRTSFDMVLVMEYAEGGTVAEEIERRRLNKAQLHLGELRLYMAEVVAAMHFLHSRHIAHRDLKPSNILLKNRHAKLADFGLSKRGQLMTAGVGTGDFRAPEVRDGKGEYTLKCDIYSYAMTFGATFGLLRQQRWGGRGGLFLPDAQNEFETAAHDLIERCWSSSAEDRPTFEELKRHAFFGSLPIPMPDGQGGSPLQEGRFSPFFATIVEGGEVDWNGLESEPQKEAAVYLPKKETEESSSCQIC